MPNITSNNFGVARMVYDGSGNIVGIKGPSGALYDPSPILYDWANIPDPSSVPAFTEIRVNPASLLQGSYRVDRPILFTSNETQDTWKPSMRQKLYGGLGSEASPIVSGVASNGAETQLISSSSNRPLLKAGLMYVGLDIYVRALVKKTGAGANATTVFYRIGYNNTLTDDYFSNLASATTAGREVNADSRISIHTLGANTVARGVFSKENALSLPTVDCGVDLVGSLDTTKDNYISISISNAGADTHDLVWFDVYIE